MDAEIIVQSKLMGFSLAELNELTTQDYMDIINIYNRQMSPSDDKEVRKATQADMDRFTGYIPK